MKTFPPPKPLLTHQEVQDFFGPLLTRKQVCAFFRIGRTKVDAMIASGELESFKDGASRRVLASSCYARLERLKAMPKPKSRWAR
jgi:hypothetical protein